MRVLFGAVAKLAKALARGDVNIIHAHNGVSHAAAVLAIAIAGKGICIVTQHFVSPARTGRTGWLAVLSEALHRWNSRHTNRFIAVSNAVAETCKVIYRCKMEDLFVIPNGIFRSAIVRFAVKLHDRSLGWATKFRLLSQFRVWLPRRISMSLLTLWRTCRSLFLIASA